jgi:hypothetical protein
LLIIDTFQTGNRLFSSVVGGKEYGNIHYAAFEVNRIFLALFLSAL